MSPKTTSPLSSNTLFRCLQTLLGQMDGMIYRFGCLFCWEESHNVLVWSSSSVQSADKHTQANSSGEKEQISPSIWNLNRGPIKQTSRTALCTYRKQLILIPPHPGGSCLDWYQQPWEREGKGRKSEKLQLDYFSHHIKAFSSPVTQYQYYCGSEKRPLTLP